MELKKNQIVVFENGHKEGYLEARWSECNKAFYTFTEDGEKIFSTTVENKPERKRAKFVPNAKNCTVLVNPVGETEKAYQVYNGSNNRVGRGFKHYYKYIAKSICYVDENGNIYAPSWV